jgi:hypothetical protein
MSFCYVKPLPAGKALLVGGAHLAVFVERVGADVLILGLLT